MWLSSRSSACIISVIINVACLKGEKMKKISLAIPLCSLFLLISTLAVSAQVKLGPKDGEGLPPTDLNRVKVGDEGPDFTLEDQDVKPVTLSDYRNSKSVVLVFYRGYW